MRSGDQPADRRSLLDWLTAPEPDKGIRSLEPDGSWRLHSYAELAHRVVGLSARFRELGLPPGSVVAVALASGADFVAAFFAALHAGATPCPVVPPLPFQQTAAYREHVLRLLAVAKPELLVTTQSLARQLGPETMAQAAERIVLIDDVDLGGVVDTLPAAPARHALLQFTSGSSGRPKAVQVSRIALEGNITAIRTWLRMTPDHSTASWLPMHHDMGLIGCLLTPIVNRSDLFLMRPEQFLRDPLAWLNCFGRLGAVITSVPDFALAYVARRVSPEALAGMDFRSWRIAIVGAERVNTTSLDAVTELLGPHGFRREIFCPAYGLAEACLAVTGLPINAEPTTIRVTADAQALGATVVEVADDEPGVDYVGCGGPLADSVVTILDDEQRPVPPGTLGEISVRSSMVADGYLGAADDDETFGPLGLRTGDAGFLLGGQLYVVGRLGDSIKHRATALFAEELETFLRDGIGAAASPVVLLGAAHGENTAVVLLETALHGHRDAVVELMAKRVPGLRVVVGAVSRRSILRTSSGKPRRRPMWREFVAGSLEGALSG
jgi:acyl-CoA synthetase (AMP-forming)/AMP-acid ligase II